MSATTYARYQETAENRFRQLLAAWLLTLPQEGWTGNVTELVSVLDEMESARRFYAFVPTGSALTKALLREESTVRAAGFALRVGRTKAARFLSFVREERSERREP